MRRLRHQRRMDDQRVDARVIAKIACFRGWMERRENDDARTRAPRGEERDEKIDRRWREDRHPSIGKRRLTIEEMARRAIDAREERRRIDRRARLDDERQVARRMARDRRENAFHSKT